MKVNYERPKLVDGTRYDWSSARRNQASIRVASVDVLLSRQEEILSATELLVSLVARCEDSLRTGADVDWSIMSAYIPQESWLSRKFPSRLQWREAGLLGYPMLTTNPDRSGWLRLQPVESGTLIAGDRRFGRKLIMDNLEQMLEHYHAVQCQVSYAFSTQFPNQGVAVTVGTRY
jgi:hypothetical protein